MKGILGEKTYEMCWVKYVQNSTVVVIVKGGKGQERRRERKQCGREGRSTEGIACSVEWVGIRSSKFEAKSAKP